MPRAIFSKIIKYKSFFKSFFLKLSLECIDIFHFKSTGGTQVEATQLARQSPLDSWDHAGGPAVARQSDGQGTAAPQLSHCFGAAVGRFASSDGNIGGSQFKDQLITN